MRYFFTLLVIMGVVTVWGPQTAIQASSSAQVPIEDVRVIMSELGPVVLLKAQERVIPIFVDPTVAGSIEGALSGLKFHRPLSHDLMHSILEAYGARVSQVRISLKDKIYFGELVISFDDMYAFL